MYLAFNTATTGCVQPDLPNSHPDQPQILRFAAAIFDERWRKIDQLVTIVRPRSDARLSRKSFMAHLITLARAVGEGIEPIRLFDWMEARARRVSCLVAHGIQLEMRILQILAEQVTGEPWSPPCPTYCTMAASRPVLNLPLTPAMRAAGLSGPRHPTLAECVRYFFGEDVDPADADDAGYDVDACIQLFRHLRFDKAARVPQGQQAVDMSL